MTKPIKPQSGIMDIALYVGGASHVVGKSDVLKLSSNENPAGPSERARDAFLRAVQQLHRYPNTDHASLRRAIGSVHGLDPQQIICGVGSDEVLQFIAQAYAGKGDEVIHTTHGFAMYPIFAKAVGAKPVQVAEIDRRIDVDGILAAITPKTRIIYIANPGNPTGTYLDPAEIKRLADGTPPSALLVLDGAYAEFVDGFDGGASIVAQHDNVIMTRTFSKLYGLGGLRIGWGYAPQAVIDVLNRIRQPFNLSEAQMAAAEAAMLDRDYAEKCRADNARMRAWLTKALTDIGVDCDQSYANFVLARFETEDRALACDAMLKDDGILVRHVANYGLAHCLRITVGDESACRRVVHTIAKFKGLR